MEDKKPSFISVEILQRNWAILEVLNDYRQELAYEKKHGIQEEEGPSDPSSEFITARELRDLHDWCPVKYLPYSHSFIMVNSTCRSENRLL